MGVASSMYSTHIITPHIAAAAKIMLPIEFINTPTIASLGTPAISVLDTDSLACLSTSCLLPLNPNSYLSLKHFVMRKTVFC